MKRELQGVYRCPGPHFGPPGITYDCKGVAEEDLDAALAEGWRTDFQDAIADYLDSQDIAQQGEDDVAAIGDDDPPSRDEMEQQAQLLGLRVDRRWSDATLLKKIETAMTEAEQAS